MARRARVSSVAVAAVVAAAASSQAFVIACSTPAPAPPACDGSAASPCFALPDAAGDTGVHPDVFVPDGGPDA